MPLYEYRCTKCGHRFDKIQKFNDEPETACPKCGGALERPLTAPALQFKGAGWYVNDYAAKPAAAGSSSEKAATESAPAGGDAKKSDAKPAESKPAATETKAAPASGSASKPASTSGTS